MQAFTPDAKLFMATLVRHRDPQPVARGIDPESLRSLEARMERELRRLRHTAALAGAVEHRRCGDETDLTADRMAQDAAFVVLARCAESIVEWSAALRRLRSDPESFGRCAVCQGPIPLERLEIVPTTRTCMGCQ